MLGIENSPEGVVLRFVYNSAILILLRHLRKGATASQGPKGNHEHVVNVLKAHLKTLTILGCRRTVVPQTTLGRDLAFPADVYSLEIRMPCLGPRLSFHVK